MCGVKTSSLSSGVKVAVDVHQLGFGTPHHHTSSAEIVDLKDAVPCEPLILVSVDTVTAISFFFGEYIICCSTFILGLIKVV